MVELMEHSNESDRTLETADPCCSRPAVFSKDAALRKWVPSSADGVEMELPDFETLKQHILHVSPLARCAVENGDINKKEISAFNNDDKVDNRDSNENAWTVLESNEDQVVHEICTIDNHGGLPCPLLRFRARLKGPACDAHTFAGLIMDYNDRICWDDQVDQVQELYPVQDLSSVSCSSDNFGKCTRLGVGYYRSKSVSMFVSAREQLTLCGIQEFENGSSIIWAKELEEWHDHLLPPGERVVRSKTHLFAVIMVPIKNEYLVEYLFQLEVGGMIPTFLTTPLMIDSVKRLFEYAASKEEEPESTIVGDELNDD